MYDELVKRLHQRIALTTAGSPLQDDLQKAADAIEELQKKLKRSKDFEAFWQHEAEEALKKFQVAISNKPRWIPVTDKENLPNTDSGVVGYFGGGAFDQLRWYDFVTTLSDGTIVGESTERDVMSEHCIAVYKLPEPPKEG